MHAAAEVARVASRVAVSYCSRGFDVDTKSDGSPVTDADRAAEMAAREWIEQRFPDDGIQGEEFGATRVDAGRQWLIDPIDGTKSFVRGVPLWGTLIAVQSGATILAGAAVLSLGEDVICAAPGAGTWWNGSLCGVSGVDRLEKALVLTTDDTFRASPECRPAWDRVRQRALMSRTWGDCYGYFMVATGRAEAMSDARLSAWDAACFVPIIEEAGGVLSDWNGAPGGMGGSLVATNSGIAKELRDVMRLDDLREGM